MLPWTETAHSQLAWQLSSPRSHVGKIVHHWTATCVSFFYCARAQCKLKHISFQQENRRSKKWWRASLELCLLNKFFSLQSIGLALCSNSIRASDQLLPCSSSPLTFEHFIYWKISFTGEYILQSDDFIYSLRKVYAIHSSIRRLHRRLICFRKGMQYIFPNDQSCAVW